MFWPMYILLNGGFSTAELPDIVLFSSRTGVSGLANRVAGANKVFVDNLVLVRFLVVCFLYKPIPTREKIFGCGKK